MRDAAGRTGIHKHSICCCRRIVALVVGAFASNDHERSEIDTAVSTQPLNLQPSMPSSKPQTLRWSTSFILLGHRPRGQALQALRHLSMSYICWRKRVSLERRNGLVPETSKGFRSSFCVRRCQRLSATSGITVSKVELMLPSLSPDILVVGLTLAPTHC